MYPITVRAKKGMWWDRAWSLVDGCTPVSEGCDNCWSREMGERFGTWPSKVTPRWDRLELPLTVNKPTIWAVWNDLFHVDVDEAFIVEALEVMAKCPQHLFLVLTKRAEWLQEDWPIPPNAWLGITAENQARLDERVPYLLQTPAAVKFLSLEPLLGPMDTEKCLISCKDCGNQGSDSYVVVHELQLCRACIKGAEGPSINWLVIGCETGPKRRPCALDWVHDIICQADDAGVPVWVKALDLGGRVSKDMTEWPAWARRREMP